MDRASHEILLLIRLIKGPVTMIYLCQGICPRGQIKPRDLSPLVKLSQGTCPLWLVPSGLGDDVGVALFFDFFGLFHLLQHSCYLCDYIFGGS